MSALYTLNLLNFTLYNNLPKLTQIIVYFIGRIISLIGNIIVFIKFVSSYNDRISAKYDTKVYFICATFQIIILHHVHKI